MVETVTSGTIAKDDEESFPDCSVIYTVSVTARQEHSMSVHTFSSVRDCPLKPNT